MLQDNIITLVLGFMVVMFVFQGHLHLSIEEIFWPFTGGLAGSIVGSSLALPATILLFVLLFNLWEHAWPVIGSAVLFLFFLGFIYLLV
ncbi:MAG: hypothetical protein V1787_00750 [Candidatus Micrarchaeota archaeon]